MLQKPISDMKNTGPRAGGSITAGLFFQQFTKKTPWAHLDIADPVCTRQINKMQYMVLRLWAIHCEP